MQFAWELDWRTRYMVRRRWGDASSKAKFPLLTERSLCILLSVTEESS